MGNHVPPADLAKEIGLNEQELIVFCNQESIPILHGRVDRTLVQAQLNAQKTSHASQAI